MTDSALDSSLGDLTSMPPAVPISRGYLFLVGLVVGATPPILFSVYQIQQFQAYTASLPPDAVVCGTPLVACFAMIYFVAPITSLVGGALILIPAVIIDCLRVATVSSLHHPSL